MKKFTMQTIVNYINDNAVEELFEVRDELTAELDKNAEKAQANRDLYDQAKDVVLANIDQTPATIAEIYEAVEDKLPEGFTKGKLQHGITKLWTAEIVKIEGNPNTYRKA